MRYIEYIVARLAEGKGNFKSWRISLQQTFKENVVMMVGLNASG